MTEERRSTPLRHSRFPTVIPAKAGTHLGRATRITIKDKKKAHPIIVIPAQAGIQQGRATRIAAKDWIPDRAADQL